MCGKVSESTEFSALVLLFSVSWHICTVTIMDGKNIKIMWSALYKSSLQTALNAQFLGVYILPDLCGNTAASDTCTNLLFASGSKSEDSCVKKREELKSGCATVQYQINIQY